MGKTLRKHAGLLLALAGAALAYLWWTRKREVKAVIDVRGVDMTVDTIQADDSMADRSKLWG